MIELGIYLTVFLTPLGCAIVYNEIKKRNAKIKQLESELEAERKKVAELELQIKHPSKFKVGDTIYGYVIESKRYRDFGYRARFFVFSLSKLTQALSKNQISNDEINKKTNEFLNTTWIYEVEKDGLKGFKTEAQLQEIINQNK